MIDLSGVPEPVGRLAELGGLMVATFRASRATEERPRMTLDPFAAKYGPDPGGFFAFCDLLEIKPKEAGAAGLVPFRLTEIQRAYSEARSPRDVILKPRQVKITSVELARDVWFFLTKKGVGVRIFCQSSTEHTMLSELSDRVKVIFRSLEKNAGLVLDFDTATRTEWKLPNGSTLKIIEAGASLDAAQKKGRGETVHRVHTTEMAFWEYAGATLNAVNESIAGPEHGTEIVHESTANGAAGESRESTKTQTGSALFYWLCQDARKQRSGFKFHFFTWMQEAEYQLPLEPGEVVSPAGQPDPERAERERQIVARGATPGQLKWYRRKVTEKGSDDTDQEYPSDPDTCFLVSGRKFFDKAKIEAMIAEAGEPLGTIEIRRSGAVGTCRIWHLPVSGRRYIIPADTSEGTGGDGAGGHVYEEGTARHMATLSGQFKPDALAKDLACLGVLYGEPGGPDALVAVERNNHGHACLQALEHLEHYRNIFKDHDEKPGWINVEVKRTAALDELERAVREGEWSSPDGQVLGEFRTFIVNKHGKAEADRGSHDDHVIMAMIGWDVLRRGLTTLDYWSVHGGASRTSAPARVKRRW